VPSLVEIDERWTKVRTFLAQLERRLPGPLLGAAAFIAIVFPRSTPFCLVLFGLWGALEARRNPTALKADLVAPVTLSLAAFAALAMLSAAWSPMPERALLKGALLLLVGAVSLLAMQLRTALAEGRVDRAVLAGISAGIALGLAFVAFEAVTDRSLTRLVFTHLPALREIFTGKHVKIAHGVVVRLGDTVPNRATCVASVLLIPGLLLAKEWNARLGLYLYAVLAAVFTACVLLASHHQSSQVALLAAMVVGLLAWLGGAWARKAVVLVWCALVLLAPLGALAMGSARLESAPWLFETAKLRVAIWESVAEKIKEHPLLGAGATTAEQTMQVDLTGIEPAPQGAGVAVAPGTPTKQRVLRAWHPHDIYLQVWYELGLVGVVILLLLGWSVFRSIESMPPDVQPYLLALFALTATMAATSYGLWQFWFEGLLALSFVTASLARAQNS
jgi:hypothetical protein